MPWRLLDVKSLPGGRLIRCSHQPDGLKGKTGREGLFQAHFPKA